MKKPPGCSGGLSDLHKAAAFRRKPSKKQGLRSDGDNVKIQIPLLLFENQLHCLHIRAVLEQLFVERPLAPEADTERGNSYSVLSCSSGSPWMQGPNCFIKRITSSAGVWNTSDHREKPFLPHRAAPDPLKFRLPSRFDNEPSKSRYPPCIEASENWGRVPASAKSECHVWKKSSNRQRHFELRQEFPRGHAELQRADSLMRRDNITFHRLLLRHSGCFSADVRYRTRRAARCLRRPAQSWRNASTELFLQENPAPEDGRHAVRRDDRRG